MIGLLTAVLIFCFDCINVSKAGMLCSERKMNWEDSIISCGSRTGTSVTIDEDNQDIIEQQLNESIQVWASGYTFFKKCDNGFNVCGYSFIEGFPTKFNNEQLYGDCNVNRNTICWQNGSFGVFQSQYYEAIKCNRYPSVYEALYLHLPPGYYWRAEKFKLCPHQYRYFSPMIASTSLCKVYNKLGGFFYVDCRSTRYAICEFDVNSYQPDGYSECLSDHNTSTVVPSSSTFREKVTTSQPTSVVITSRQSYVSTRKTTQYNHISDLTTPSTYSTLSYKTSTVTSDTNDFTSGNGNVVGVISTATSPHTQEQQNDRQEETNLGLKIGLPVALCVVLFGVHVITLIVYFRRRHRNNGRDENKGEFEDNTVGAISTTNQLQTRNETTVTYEAYNNAANDDSVEHVYTSLEEGDNYEII